MKKFTQKNADLGDAVEMGLLAGEYDKICEILNRVPNYTELCIFSVMWSEHCSYKNSIAWLKKLPKKGAKILVEAGEENAGLVDIGDGQACVFKIESHNHPSALEPYQGAATGVGGINRDIFTMGARPIAQLNSLRFGDINLPHTKWLMKGVVKGIGDYGNSFGIPIVGGETYFDKSYNTNPLVNAFSAGVVNTENVISAVASGKDNPVFIVGSSTGKDGINGAAFASKDLTEDSADDIPSVQVGDPFQEKLLLEATMELSMSDAIIGMQDMGAAGIICSTSEMSASGNCGMEINLDKIPTRQKNMKPFEILLSESQERMLVVVKKGNEKKVQKIFEKWDLNCEKIGKVTDSKNLLFYYQKEIVAKVPAESLVLGGGAPVYHRDYKEPAYYKEFKKFDINNVSIPFDIVDIAHQVISLPNICSKKWVYEQYDSMVGTVNMTTNNPSDAAVINLKGTNKSLAFSVDCNSRYVKADPQVGCEIAVAEAARNIVCSGAKPTAVTNCLNFGNPYDPEVYWQFVGSIQGMTNACKKFKTPVTGGNVSFYNQTSKSDSVEPCFPTPTIGMLGVMQNKKHFTTLDFKNEKDLIFLLGPSKDDISSSEYLVNILNIENSSVPYFDLEVEYKLHEVMNVLIKSDCLESAHDVSEGGLFTSLVESLMPRGLGCEIYTDQLFRQDAYLFGESQSRILVSVNSKNEKEFKKTLKKFKFPFYKLGYVSDNKVLIDDIDFGNINLLKEKYNTALEKKIN
ncbi:MAG: phosphoribosylformylglycinamidine synthase II [Flavobacteriales bacterium]|nr:phosphoribosylformylglycinamidine synthase II [Flavobacteriales bacterium]|tara:strand:- start:19726 stop:21960 length:2235 start_codon:yes stop_codon:yes gene_type:complete